VPYVLRKHVVAQFHHPRADSHSLHRALGPMPFRSSALPRKGGQQASIKPFDAFSFPSPVHNIPDACIELWMARGP
jgi:hypothetical protein